jgi:hypothetical protein
MAVRSLYLQASGEPSAPRVMGGLSASASDCRLRALTEKQISNARDAPRSGGAARVMSMYSRKGLRVSWKVACGDGSEIAGVRDS